MAEIKFRKEVSRLPEILEPDTVYYIRTGTGFDLYVQDHTGRAAHKLNGSSVGGNSDYDFFALREELLNEYPRSLQWLEELTLANSKLRKEQIQKLYKILLSDDIIRYLLTEPGDYNLLNRLMSNNFIFPSLINHPKLSPKISKELILKYQPDLNQFTEDLKTTIIETNYVDTNSILLYRSMIGSSFKLFEKLIQDLFDRIEDKAQLVPWIQISIAIHSVNNSKYVRHFIEQKDFEQLQRIDFRRYEEGFLNSQQISDDDLRKISKKCLYLYFYGLLNRYTDINSLKNFFCRTNSNLGILKNNLNMNFIKLSNVDTDIIIETLGNTYDLLGLLFSNCGTDADRSPGKFMFSYETSRKILSLNDYKSALDRRIQQAPNDSHSPVVRDNMNYMPLIVRELSKPEHIENVKKVINHQYFHESFYYYFLSNRSWESLVWVLCMMDSVDNMPLINEIANNRSLFNKIRFEIERDKNNILNGNKKHLQYTLALFLLAEDKRNLISDDISWLMQFPLTRELVDNLKENGFENSWLSSMIVYQISNEVSDQDKNIIINHPNLNSITQNMQWSQILQSSIGLSSTIPDNIIDVFNAGSVKKLQKGKKYTKQELIDLELKYTGDLSNISTLQFFYNNGILQLQILENGNLERFIKSTESQRSNSESFRVLQKYVKYVYSYVTSNSNYREIEFWDEDGISHNHRKYDHPNPIIVFASLGSWSDRNSQWGAARAIKSNPVENLWPNQKQEWDLDTSEKYNSVFISSLTSPGNHPRTAHDKNKFPDDVNCWWGREIQFKEYNDGAITYQVFEYTGP